MINEISKLFIDDISETEKEDIEHVLTLFFERFVVNIKLIEKELIKINYRFKQEPIHYNCQKAYHKPLSNTSSLLDQLKNSISDFGHMPLSLEFFYTIVGGINFAADFENSSGFYWPMADPIQMVSLDSLVPIFQAPSWNRKAQDIVNEGFLPYIEVSADAHHKDNISGGMPYAIEISKEQLIDGKFLFESNEVSFLGYLRIVIQKCGFPGLSNEILKSDFFQNLKSQLLPI